MTVAASNPAGLSYWTARHGQWLLVALILPFVAAPPVYAISRHVGISFLQSTAVALAAVALGGLQLRHSLAAVRGERPAGWPATLLAIVLIAYVPVWWFTWDWANTQWFVLASVAMLLPGRLVVAVSLGMVVGNAVMFSWDYWAGGASVALTVTWTVYWLSIVLMGALALYGSARLIRVVDDLQAARLELAELAVGRERLRVSRDLHDLLGQSLSAVSLKGDLALRLLPSDTEAARTEIEGLTEEARRALHEVRAVTHDKHTVSLGGEIDAARRLLAAAGVVTEIAVDLPGPAGPPDDVLAWAVREGTTNLLRHSDAQRCWIRAATRAGVATLEMVNDGVRGDRDVGGPVGHGTGLVGLAERARASSGSVTAGRISGGRFRLMVEIRERERVGGRVGTEETPA